MDRDNTPVGRRTAQEQDDVIGRPRSSNDGGEVMEAYDEVDGTASYVLAAMDADDAWIAVPEGVELDSTEWR